MWSMATATTPPGRESLPQSSAAAAESLGEQSQGTQRAHLPGPVQPKLVGKDVVGSDRPACQYLHVPDPAMQPTQPRGLDLQVEQVQRVPVERLA